MARRSSSSREVLLGLLSIQPMSGYDLGQAIRASIGFFWNESYGQIYPSLKRLAAAGLVHAKAEKQRGKPDRQVYSITGKGRAHLAAWLALAPQPEIPRNELLLKLFFGARVSPAIMAGFVERMAEGERAVLRKIEKVRDVEIAQLQHLPDAPYWQMTARFGQLELEAHLRWAGETLAALRAIAKRRPTESKTENRAGRHLRLLSCLSGMEECHRHLRSRRAFRCAGSLAQKPPCQHRFSCLDRLLGGLAQVRCLALSSNF
jgi:DNA-binding PadR family transcriptional regulator